MGTEGKRLSENEKGSKKDVSSSSPVFTQDNAALIEKIRRLVGEGHIGTDVAESMTNCIRYAQKHGAQDDTQLIYLWQLARAESKGIATELPEWVHRDTAKETLHVTYLPMFIQIIIDKIATRHHYIFSGEKGNLHQGEILLEALLEDCGVLLYKSLQTTDRKDTINLSQIFSKTYVENMITSRIYNHLHSDAIQSSAGGTFAKRDSYTSVTPCKNESRKLHIVFSQIDVACQRADILQPEKARDEEILDAMKAAGICADRESKSKEYLALWRRARNTVHLPVPEIENTSYKYYSVGRRNRSMAKYEKGLSGLSTEDFTDNLVETLINTDLWHHIKMVVDAEFSSDLDKKIIKTYLLQCVTTGKCGTKKVVSLLKKDEERVSEGKVRNTLALFKRIISSEAKKTGTGISNAVDYYNIKTG